MSNERRGYVVLITKPGDDRFYGPVELSFSLDVRVNETQYNWSSENASSNMGEHNLKVDGLENAKRRATQWEKNHPDWTFQIFDVNDPFLPIVIDWAKYDRAAARSDKTLSGVVDKYHARNLSFYKKNAHELAAGVAETCQPE